MIVSITSRDSSRSGPRRRAAVRARPGSSGSRKFLRDVAAERSQHRFGMELDAVDGQRRGGARPSPRRPAPSPRPRSTSGTRRRRERVVAPGEEVLGQAGEDAAAVVRDRSSPCRARARAPGRPRRRRAARAPGGRGRRRASGRAGAGARGSRASRPRPRGGPGPGEIDEVRRRERLRLVGRDRVVAAHDDLGAELAEQVREVVGERVVVVDQQDHRALPPRARSPPRAPRACAGTPRARRRDRSRRRSRRRPAGSARPSCRTTVRIAMHASSATPGQRGSGPRPRTGRGGSPRAPR